MGHTAGSDITWHTESGLLGMGPPPDPETSRVYSDLAAIDVGPALSADGGAQVVETYGVSHRDLEEMLRLRLGSAAG